MLDHRRTTWFVLAGLAALTIAAYAPVWSFGFVSLDDPLYVSGNPHVTSGLTADSIAWAFTAGYAANWHPVTWMSHMLDVSLFGVSAPAMHVVSLTLHLANTLLLFTVLRRLTRAFWPCAAVAALFAVHPLHIESVAWIAERKDVLSTFWWLVTMWLYVRYVEARSPGRYALVLASFAVALMAKPMVVTLPFVLLLLDYWPLQRLTFLGIEPGAVQGPGFGVHGVRTGTAVAKRGPTPQASRLKPAPQAPSLKTLLLEKAPLLLLAAASSLITYVVQRSAGAMNDFGSVPLGMRVENAVVSYGRYARDMVWPSGLAVFYPFPRVLPIETVLLALVVLAAITAGAIALRRRAPYVIVGWLWYLGTLVPVIGIVQVGAQARADRYTYVPLIGLFIAIAWGASTLIARLRESARPIAGAVLMAAVVLPLAVLTNIQLKYWHDPMSLWQRALNAVTDNYRADASLGMLYLAQGETAQAVSHFERAVTFEPDFMEAQLNLALLLAEHGQLDEAMPHFREVVRITPNSSRAHTDLGQALAQQGQFAEAITELQRGVDLDPSSAIAESNLGAALAQTDRLADALPHFEAAVRLQPDYETAHLNLALALAHLGRFADADREFVDVLRINPSNAQAQQAHHDLARAAAGGGS
jgi:tetratricopeptide (TPR) repeat protein